MRLGGGRAEQLFVVVTADVHRTEVERGSDTALSTATFAKRFARCDHRCEHLCEDARCGHRCGHRCDNQRCEHLLQRLTSTRQRHSVVDVGLCKALAVTTAARLCYFSILPASDRTRA